MEVKKQKKMKIKKQTAMRRIRDLYKIIRQMFRGG